MNTWIGDVFRSNRGWSHLEALVDIGNRMAGSDGERSGALATRDALTAAGLREVRMEPFDLQGWRRGESTLRAGGTSQECIALPRSPSESVTAPLVNLEYGLPEDFDRDLSGMIVMARSDVPEWYERYVHRSEKYYHAVAAGADGFIYRNHVPGCLPPTGSIGTLDKPIGPIPAIGVSEEVGSRLARRWTDTEVDVSVSAEIEPAQSQNIYGEIGPATDEVILLTSHIDAHDIAEGAADNALGTALVVEIAGALAAREADLETRVECVVFGGEEVGLLGSRADAAWRDLEPVKAVVNVDGLGRGRTLTFHPQGSDGLAAAAERLADRFDHPLDVTPRLGPHSDHWPYVHRGIPGYQVTSERDGRGRGWGHTQADTIDKLDRRDLREQAILLTDLVIDLARQELDLPRRDEEEIQQQLESERLAEGMKTIGEWPY